MKLFGILLSLLSFAVFAVERFNGYQLSQHIAKRICGERYGELFNGVLTDQSCGFDADMQLVAICFILQIVGIIAVIVGLRRQNNAL